MAHDSALPKIKLFTDGSCLNNPGPGGWAALLRFNTSEKMLSGGQSETTNNQMELQAAIEGLKALSKPCEVELYTDSKLSWMVTPNGWRAGKNVAGKNQTENPF